MFTWMNPPLPVNRSQCRREWFALGKRALGLIMAFGAGVLIPAAVILGTVYLIADMSRAVGVEHHAVIVDPATHLFGLGAKGTAHQQDHRDPAHRSTSEKKTPA